MKSRYKKILIVTIAISLFAAVLGLVRVLLTGYTSYIWLNWNLFLALVPLFCAWLLFYVGIRYVRTILFIVWLGFLPNAPYLLTDFIHLDNVGPQALLWYDALMIFSYSIAGLLAWVASFDIVRQQFNWKKRSVFIIAILTGFGIYLGRYIRFNTWDIITNPISIIQTIGEIFTQTNQHEPVVLMTIVFTFFLVVFYYAFNYLIFDEKNKK